MPPAGIAAAPTAPAAVVFAVDGLRINDRPLLPQLRDQLVVDGREVDVVAGVGGCCRPHVLRAEGVLQAEGNTVHRQLVEVGLGAVFLVQLQRDFESVGVLPEILAHGRGPGGQRAR